MNRDIPFGRPDTGNALLNEWLDRLYLGVQDWLQLPFPTSASDVLTAELTSSRRCKWAAGGSGDCDCEDLQAQIDALQEQIYALGGGGTPDPGASPSYANTGGWGDRSGIITVTESGGGVFAGDPVSDLINGTYAGEDVYMPTNATPAGMWLKFDFGSPCLITEARCYQGLVGAHNLGTWQWEGSNNDALWTAIGSTFAFDTSGGLSSNPGGGGIPGSGYDYFPMTSLNSNAFLWRWYRIRNISGSWGSRSDNLREFEFKIDGL